VKLKQAIGRLEKEIIEIDVEVGVIEQSLLQAQLKDSTQLNMVDVPM
jgi:hypothetical protein